VAYFSEQLQRAGGVMRPYQLRKTIDGRWEAVPQGTGQALFVFDSADDVAAFAKVLGRHGRIDDPAMSEDPATEASSPSERAVSSPV
jgi:hypothetical protein